MSDKMKAYNGNVVHLTKPKSEPGGWLASKSATSKPAMIERDRVGRQAATVLFGASVLSSEQYGSYNRILTNEQLWLCYQRVPDVRACVDAITRRVATWNWLVAPTASPDSENYSELLKASEEAVSFLKAPNRDGETWQELWTKIITDLLVFDAGVVENVYGGQWTNDGLYDADGNIEELVALRGSTIYPIVDMYGRVEGYKQSYTGIDVANSSYQQEATDEGALKKALFTPEQIVYMRVFANTQSPLGSPVIESIVNEVITMLRSSEHTMLAMDADEIPPGILVLTGIAGQAASAAMADLQNMRGKDHKVRVITTPDPKGTGASWVELRHKAKDVDFVNVINEVKRTIWRVFGVLPIEMGASEDLPRSVGQVQLDVSTSHLINPILELIEAKINARILPLVIKDKEVLEQVSFSFDRESKLSTIEQKEKSAALNTLVMQGLMTRNEARQDIGLPPVINGDVMTITTGQGTFTLDQIVHGTVDHSPEPTDNDGGPGTASPPSDSQDDIEDVEEDVLEDAEVLEAISQPNNQVLRAKINMTPTKGVVSELKKGLNWHKEGHSGDGLRPATVAWARRMANGADISEDKVRKMRAWLARHESDKEGKGFYPNEDGFPSPGRVAWALWGGDPAVAWSNKLVRQLDAEKKSIAHEHGTDCDVACRDMFGNEDLPSEWQPAGRFADVRTVNLVELHNAVVEYQKSVLPLYNKMQDNIVADVAANYTPDSLNDADAVLLISKVNRHIDRLANEWALVSEQFYERAGQIGVDAARQYTGQQVAPNALQKSLSYGDEAMVYLTNNGGLLNDLKVEMTMLISAMSIESNARPEARAIYDVPKEVNQAMSKADAARVASDMVGAQRFRTSNWTGKLVNLCTLAMAQGLLEASTSVNKNASGPAIVPTEWYAEWVSVGDSKTCPTCTAEGKKGFRSVQDFSLMPGGMTECGAKCRCVIVVWTKQEILSGEAISFSNTID